MATLRRVARGSTAASACAGPARLRGALASASADGGDGRPRRALLVEVLHGDMGRPLALVVDDAEGFRRVVRVLEIWEGINGDEDARVDELRLEDVVGDAEPEALLRTTSTLEDSDCTEPLAWDTRRSDLVVCTLPARAAPTCTDRIPLRFHEIERSYDDGDRPRVRRVTRYATRVVLERDGIVVVRESGRVPRAARGVMGRYRITGANGLLRPRDAADGDGARAP